eukprot:2206202-Rhodomonas_salina.4
MCHRKPRVMPDPHIAAQTRHQQDKMHVRGQPRDIACRGNRGAFSGEERGLTDQAVKQSSAEMTMLNSDAMFLWRKKIPAQVLARHCRHIIGNRANVDSRNRAKNTTLKQRGNRSSATIASQTKTKREDSRGSGTDPPRR